LLRHPKDGVARAKILSDCPGLDRNSQDAEAGFKPRTFRSSVHDHESKDEDKRSAVMPFLRLGATSPEGNKMTGILIDCPNLGRSRDAEVGPRSFRRP
ncbi:hypothetical protein T265_14419, partial [Opisthorchis viverrini]